MHQLHVELTGLIQCLADRLLGDLVKHHPLDRHLGGEQLQQMPADALPFAVLVRGEQQLFGSLEGVLQLADDLFLVLRDHIEGLEIGLGVHAKIRPFLTFCRSGDLTGVVGQIANMTHRRFNLEPLRQEAADGSGLRGAFNDDEGVRQRCRP